MAWSEGQAQQVGLTVSGPARAANCERVLVTNRFVNNGATVSGLWITNSLPSANYAYVPGYSTVTLPNGAVLTGTNAEPAVNNNSTNLVWDFTNVVSSSTVTNLLITEVFYKTTKNIDQWIEIYNPTTNTVVASGWSLMDTAPGQTDALPDFTIVPGEFVIVAGSATEFLDDHPGYSGQVLEVADFAIGSGLNSFGDGVILRNAASNWVDAVSYGASTAAFSPSVPTVAAGSSIERSPANNDTNTRNDWVGQATPNPGSGNLPVGMQSGDAIVIVYALEIDCGAISGQIFSRAGFEQPPGTPRAVSGSMFLTVNEPDLVVTKNPILQSAGFGDTVTWTVRVENAGFGGAPNVAAMDRIGPGFVFTGFSVPPTASTASNAIWDAAAIPGFTNLAAGATVDIVVTARVTSCAGLYNRADAIWGCGDLEVLPNGTCEDTSLINETATAGIQFIDRYPSLSGSISPSPISVSYCSGAEVTLYLTNATGASIGYAENLQIWPYLPLGWQVTGVALSNGYIVLDHLPPASSTSVTFTVEAGGDCPINLDEQWVMFLPSYSDGCSNLFQSPLLSTKATVGAEPGARITKIMPASVSGDDGSFPVRIELAYSNFVGGESILVTDLFPVHTNLTVTNVSAGGVRTSNSVTWTMVAGAGSGVVTASFDVAIGDPCGGPWGMLYNTLLATNYVDCQGCTRSVAGNGARFPIRLQRGAACTGGCGFASSKDVYPEMGEICGPVLLTHTFYGLGSLTNDWTGVQFTANLAGGNGSLVSTNDIVVMIDGSNVTAHAVISQTAPSLVLDLSGLNGSAFPVPSNVVTSLVIAYPVQVEEPGTHGDYSYLTIPGCGAEGEEASWNAGGSRMEIGLRAVDFATACGPSEGVIDLTMQESPENTAGIPRLFPAYDVEVTLDLDHDGDLFAGFEYVAGSTVFSNVLDLSGTPVPAFDPAITGNRLTWELGDLRTNENMSIRYRLRSACSSDTNGQTRAELLYNTRCGDGTADPPSESRISRTNGAPLFASASLMNNLQPELQFLVDTQIVTQVRVINTAYAPAYNLRVEMVLPPNVAYGGSEFAPATVTATNVVWEFQGLPGPRAPLYDFDGDGEFDDLYFGQPFEFGVTNYMTSCGGGDQIVLRSSFGCGGDDCHVTADSTARFVSISGSLVTRATFPVENALCSSNPVYYSVRNSGLTMDYDVKAFQTLPTGIAYYPGSSEVSINGGAFVPIADPPGTGLPGDPLTWTSAQIPEMAAMQPNDEVTIHYNVLLGCDGGAGGGQFVSEGSFTDLCGTIVSNREVVSVLSPDQPLLELDKSSLLSTADLGETNVYTITIRHAAASEANVPYMTLTDVLPAAVTFAGASVAPDAVSGQTLIWSNDTLNAQTGDFAAPFALGEPTITILVTGIVNNCAASVINTASLTYGCSESNACLSASDNVSIITTPRLTPPGLVGAMTLNTCGGTKTVTVTNSGASTDSDIQYTEWAPPGYVFTGASVAGEFTAANLTVTYGGTPHGSVATVDFSTAAACGAVDAKDDILDGLDNLELGKSSAFTVTWTLASAGENLDCLADPTDLDFEDPEQGEPSSLTSSNRLDYTDLCGESGVATGINSTYPGIPNLDIDLQPNSQIVTNGEVVSFVVTVLNNSETADADGVFVRVKMGEGWDNVTYVSSNIVSSGATAMDFEQQGNTNLLFNFPGVILDPVNDRIELFFSAEVTQNGGPLTAVAEVVGDCDSGEITPSCVFTNTLGWSPLADTMQGSVLNAVNGQYYSFDQDRFVAAGHTLIKTVRYDEEGIGAAGTNRNVRVGEDLIYRIEALYFGGNFSGAVIADTLPEQLAFGTPENYAFSGGVTGAVWDAGTGVFTLQPATFTTNPSTFAVDIPVVVSNRMDVQDGVVITNAASADFVLEGFTNAPLVRTTEVTLFEPVLQITKSVNSNLVQAGDILIYTNRLVHTAASRTSAYSIVFTDTLPHGVIFNSFISPPSGDVSGQTITFNTNHLAALGEFKTNDAPIDFVFSVMVTNQLVGATITNRSSAIYVSLDNDSVNGNERDGEDGTGGLNNYYTESETTFTSATLKGISKTYVSSSQTNTLTAGGTNDWTIGERFVYQIRVDMPQGVVSNLVLTDTVPSGIDWVGANTNVGLSYPGRGYEFEIPVGGPQFPTNIVDGLAIADTDPTPASSTTTDGSGLPVVFTFGAITNTPDGDLGNDYFLLRLEFVALDQAVNVGTNNAPRRGSNVVSMADGFTTLGATGPVYRIVQHDIQALKQRTPGTNDAGDVVTFTLVVSNHVNALANAYDVLVTDVLSSNVYDFSAFNVLGTTPGWNTELVGTSGGRIFRLFSVGDTALPRTSIATSRFEVALAQTVRPGQIYTNRMIVEESTTLYGPPPGGIAERNDTATNTVTFLVPGLSVAKSLDSTSETENPPDSTGSNVQIGEVLTYRVSVTLPESTVTNLTVVDRMSTNGLAYVFGSARVDTNGFEGNVGTFTESPAAGANPTSAMAQVMTFSFTNVVATGGAGTTSNTFHLLLDYLVLNSPTNRGLSGGQTVQTNRATLTYTGIPGGVVVTSAPVTSTVVEPRLQIFKSFSTNVLDAGDVVTVMLAVTNSGLATAYDVQIADVLDPVVFDYSSLANLTAPTGFVFDTGAPTTLAIRSDTNAPTGTNTIEAGESLNFSFDVAVAGTVRANQVYTNAATVAGDSLASTNVFGVQRFTGDTNSATFTVPGLALAKTLHATSETNLPPDSTGANVQIGEVVTYRLTMTLPETTLTNLTLVDTLSTNGLAYVFGSARLDTAGFGGNAGDVAESPGGAPGSLSAMGQQMTFTFTNVVVTGDNDTNNNSFVLLADYLVRSNAANRGVGGSQTVHTNRATLTYGGNPGGAVTSAVVNTTVIEPRLQIIKTLTPTNHVDAGDVIFVTLTATNSGTATAYDVAIEDVLALPFFDMSTLANVVMPTGFVYEVAGDVLRILSDTNAPTGTNTIEVGESLVFTFDVHTAGSLPPNTTVTNRATVLGDSLASTNVWEEQRFTGDTNRATFVSSDFSPSKILFATSETGPADSTGASLQVGEIATYEISVGLPEGTIADLQITDFMPTGMAYVVGSLVVITNDLSGTLAPVTNITPNAGLLGASGQNVVVVWEGNSVLSATTNASSQILRLRLDAVVLNVPANTGLVPQKVMTNSASVTFAGNPNPPVVVVGPPVTLIEPQIGISKGVSPDRGDAGDEITITLVATNSGLATAYDLLVEDALDGAVFNVASITNVSMPEGFVFSTIPGPADVTVRYASDVGSGQATNTLEAGESLQFVFTAHLAQDVEPGAFYTNAVAFQADTIYETNSVGIQRGYTNSAQDTLTISNMVIAKALARTSATGPADTTGSNVTIGERATYRLTVTLPESTMTNLTVADAVPAGMRFVTNSTVVDVAGFGGSLPGAPGVATTGGSGDDVTFTFNGLTVVTNNNNGADNSFAIEFDLLTLDVGSNTGTVSGSQTVLPNSASVAYGGYPPVHTSGVVNVSVVEPLLAITKTMSPASNSVVMIDLVVTNRGLSTAFDVEIEDVLPTTWWDTDTIAPVTVPDGFTFGFTGNPGHATITILSDSASGQPTNSIEVGESVLFQFRATLIDGASSPVTNRAVVTEHSTLDGDDPEERDEPDVEDEDVLSIPSYAISKVLTSPLGRPAEVGEVVTFQIAVTNTGSVGLDPVLLEDRYDTTYLTYGSAVPASIDNGNDGTIHWTNVGPLAVGGSVTVAVQFVAHASTQPGDTTNRAVASPYTTNGLPLLPKTNAAPVEIVTVGYTLEKDRTSPSNRAAQVGEPVVFTLSVVNTGEVDLVTLPVEDVYDTNDLTYVSSVPASDDNVSDGSIHWTDIGPLPVGASTQIVATFTAARSTLGLSRTNVVVASPTTTNAPPVFPKTNDAPYEILSAGYTLEKDRTSPLGRPAILGEAVAFEILVTNTGEVDLVTVPVVDAYETNYLVYVSSVPASDDNANDGQINWTNIGPLPVGSSTTIVATFTAAADTLGADRTNVVVTMPTTPTNAPPVPTKTNDAPYAVDVPATLGDFVWLDANGNGIQDGGEVGVSNVVVTLYNFDDVAIMTTTTDVSGAYAFTNLVPNDYYVRMTLPPGYVFTPQDQGADDSLDSNADPTTGRTSMTTLISGENDPTWDAGLYVPASIGNYVWNDLNANGVQDGGETGIVGVAVTLYDATNGVMGVATTDVAGAYAFTNLIPADYHVGVTVPNGWYVSPLNQGGDAALDSDADVVTGQMAATTLVSGENDLTWDAGLYVPASLGDVVWLDANGDGVQDVGEVGVSNVVVTLYDAATNALGVTTTSVSGAYAFTNLVPTTYFVGFTLPTGYAFTLQNQGGDDALDSDADRTTGFTIPTTLISGENDPTWDAGLYVPASLGNYVWNDLNANGVQDGGETGIVGVAVTLYDATNGVMGVATTDVAGAYAFTNLIPADYHVGVTVPGGWYVSPLNQGGDDALDSDAGVATGQMAATTLVSGENDLTWDAGLYLPASLGDVVWLDANGDGVQDGGEVGVSNVVVTLYDAATNSLGATTTSVSGAYAFTNLVPATYFVGFTLPTGYAFTLQNQGGDDALDSDADRTTGFTVPTTLISGENDPTWDAGLYVPASIGNFVWNDLNANGVQDGGEVGVSNVAVTLYDATNGVMGVATTDVAGAYAFTNLIPADYHVGVAVPNGWYVSPLNQGGDAALDSDADVATGQMAATTLVSGENDLTWDAGLYLPASLGDVVWLDANGDGVQDVGEVGVSNVVVTLYDAATNSLGATTTSVSGAYAFTNLVPATYFVGFTLPTGYAFTLQNQGGDDALDSDADRTTGFTVPTTLISGENDPTWDAGLYVPASIGNYVWNDLNANGVQDGGETGIVGVVVTLYDATNGVMGVATTDVAGAYAFTNLIPATYSVGVTVPGGWFVSPLNQGGDAALDSDADVATGQMAATTLVSGENDLTWDAGLYLPASLGDVVWLDANGDGVQDVGEVGVSNVVVTLYDAATNSLGATTTSVSGAYAFTNLVPSTYSVGFTLPTGYAFTLQNQGGDDALDSDADRTTGLTVPTTLISGENDPTWDAGLYVPASIGNYVWNDLNANGVQDGGEVGVSNVVVTLYDATNGVMGVATTDVAGAYAFTNLIPADYHVGVTVPGGWYVSPLNQGGDDALDSDADVATGQMAATTLVSGENDLTWDAGLYLPASLGDVVWLDANGDGVQDVGEVGVSNVVVTLYDAATNSLGVTTTLVSGAYAFTNLVPATYSVGFTLPTGYAFTLQNQGGDDALDSDADRTTGFTVPTTLISGENDPTWDAGLYVPASIGNYVWNDLNANGVQDGGETGIVGVAVTLYDATNGVMGVATTDVAGAYAFTNLIPADYHVGVTVPGGWYVSPLNQGGDAALDSDAGVATGQMAATTLVSGENDLTWDAGLYLPASLGDFVWLDANGNGIQDGGEVGVPNVVVTLYDAATNALGATTTSVSGAYAFTNLVPATYSVGFTLPTGYAFTLQNQGGDDALDSDADRTTGFTVPTTLISGENDPTWDAGLYVPASIGNYVWNDLNANGVQDGGETGIVGVAVTLYDATNGVMGVATTDVAGAYAFTNLIPADYHVGVAVPGGWFVSPLNQGGDDALDSDADVATGQMATTTLVSGENDLTWDAGLYLPASLGDVVWLDANGDGVQDVGEVGVSNVVVTLYDAATNALGATTTSVSGAYAFTNLVPATYSVGFTLPTGYAFTLQNQGGDAALDSDADVATGFTIPTTLISGENDPTWDAGLYVPASLGNFVWDDLNGNGIQDPNEPGIPSVTVRLYDAATNLLATRLTDTNGLYLFESLIPAEYTVLFVRPSGYQFTLQNQGGDDALDSDADPITGRAASTVLATGDSNLSWDAGMYKPASVGDFVWLDENWDGIQDPGEAGIANVRIELLDGASNVVASTLTDLNGFYLFSGLPPGDYTVRVDASTLAPELAANPTFDLDGTMDGTTSVTLISGDAIRDVDFGYNWNPDVDLLGSIGDRIWVDANANGIQDPGEPGIPGVTVSLFVDSAGNGNYTTAVATATTDASGLYLFPGLGADAYVVRVDTNTLPAHFIQTGDPDTFGTSMPAGTGDHQTTSPIVLSPGDVFVNADFGYWFPNASNLGDLIYLDLNANGSHDPVEPGIAGVTVVLLNNAGQVIASTLTDENGNYLFTGLPAGTYTVWVNDAAGILIGLDQTGDPDGGLDSRSTTTLDGVHDDLDQDHGYVPDGHGAGLGLIGDTVFLDRNGNGQPDAGEGIQGVTVHLYDATGTNLLATTATDANGNYYFGGLDAGTYVVQVDGGTLPNAGGGLVNTVDPDTANPGDSRSTVVLPSGGMDLDQDFGYVPTVPNTIGGTLWRDCNANGALEPDETPRWEGVKIVLRDEGGRTVGTTFTDADGTYAFTELPDGVYTVDVVDVANVLNGFWHSLGPNPGAEGNSQSDPFVVMVSGGETNNLANFGYYLVVTELGDYVWYDINGNGIQDGGEPGLAGVQVTLTIAYPSGNEIVMKTLTDERGHYLFANLLLDERYGESTLGDPAVVGLPRFQISVVSSQRVLTADGYVATLVDAGNGSNDSREHAGTFALLNKCGRPVRYDFGYRGGPLLAVMGKVEAFVRDGQTVVRWEILESWDTAGFWLERKEGTDWVRISSKLIPYPMLGPSPVVFEEIDPGAVGGSTYTYRLVELENGGDLFVYGPYELKVDGPNPPVSAWDEGYLSLGAGWRRLDWFGDYTTMGVEGWIWHNKHGFFYVASDSTAQGLWLFAPDMGWLWTANTVYPFLYRAKDNAWLWFNGSSEPRWFFNLTQNRWENRP